MSLKRRAWVAAGLAVAVGGLAAGFARGEIWNQFRGPTMQGVSSTTNLPEVLDSKQGVVWNTPIDGKAWSSPVVGDGKVWVTNATKDGKVLSVVRLDAGSGKIELNEVLFNIANPQFCHDFNSYASPSPILDGERLYVTFGSPGTACLDVKTGKKIWERTDFVCNHFRGAGSSPTLWKDRLLMNFDGSDFQYVVALDKQTGKTLWKTDRSVDYRDIDPKTQKPKSDGDFRKGFSTPRVITLGGKEQLLSIGGKAAYGYDLETGKELWRLEFFKLGIESHTPSGTPIVGDGLIIFATGHGKGELIALKPGDASTASADQIVWRMKKNVPNRSSPLLVDGRLYMSDDSAMATCVDVQSGKEIWKERIGGKAYSASPILADRRIYFFGEDGTVTTLQPGPAFKVLGKGQFAEGFMGTPAVADGAFFLRTKGGVLRVQK